MPEEILGVVGYRELIRALKQVDAGTRRAVRSTLREAGEGIRADATARMSSKHAKTAAGYRVVVRQRGIAVEQSLKKTTGKHPEWGAYQMKHALLPARADHEADTEHRMETAVEQIAERFNETG